MSFVSHVGREVCVELLAAVLGFHFLYFDDPDLKWTCLTGKIGHRIHAVIGITSVNSFIWGVDKFDRFPKRMEKTLWEIYPNGACEKYWAYLILNHQPANLMFSYCLLCFPITYIPLYPHPIPILSPYYPHPITILFP